MKTQGEHLKEHHLQAEKQQRLPEAERGSSLHPTEGPNPADALISDFQPPLL